jgi:hypothetical protein
MIGAGGSSDLQALGIKISKPVFALIGVFALEKQIVPAKKKGRQKILVDA